MAPADERPLRLFVAFDVPDDVRDLVDHAVEPIRERYPRARWVPLENQHVTVTFLGETPARLLATVMDRLETVAARHRPFSVRAAKLGAFPSPRLARVLWVGLDDPAARSSEIATDLAAALAPEFVPDARPFTPHLTVARFDPAVALGEGVVGMAVESRPFEVSHLTLYRSAPRGPGVRYDALARAALR